MQAAMEIQTLARTAIQGRMEAATAIRPGMEMEILATPPRRHLRRRRLRHRLPATAARVMVKAAMAAGIKAATTATAALGMETATGTTELRHQLLHRLPLHHRRLRLPLAIMGAAPEADLPPIPAMGTAETGTETDLRPILATETAMAAPGMVTVGMATAV